MRLFNKLLQGSVLLALAALVVLLWRPAPRMALALALLGGTVILLMFLVQRRRLSEKSLPARTPSTPEEDERRARFVVTQLLGDLTRTQVTYLRQDFRDPDEGRAWLKRILPRSYGGAIKQMHQDLEAARSGQNPKSLRLALRILRLYEERMQSAEEAVLGAAKTHPDHALAHPVIFVITEHIKIDQEDSEPELSLAATWDPTKATILPIVDTLTILAKKAEKRQATGQLTFTAALEHCGEDLQAVRSLEGKSTVYAAKAHEPREDISMTPIPLGFIIGSTELT